MLAMFSMALVLSAGQGSPAQTAAATAMTAVSQAGRVRDGAADLRVETAAGVRPPTGLTSELLKQVNDEKLALAKSCLARFDAATIAATSSPGSRSSTSRPDSPRRAAPR